MNLGVEMFGTSRRHRSGGPVGPVLISKRFVWPHGGRMVFLTGSFTRWTTVIPMSPKEGCPTVFQVICGLTPGYHQYKFNVDGEWRHDEHQPFVCGDGGTVNTFYLVRQPVILPPIVNGETPGRSHMEVDYDVVGHVEAKPRMSESDLQVSRHRISVFLSTHTAYELLPESGKVVALDITLPVKQAFHALYEEGISSAPVWDSSKCQFVGMLSAMDFILILKQLGIHGSNMTEEQLETHTIAAWREAKEQECAIDSKGRAYPQHLVHAGPLECLKDVALKILQDKVATVPIIQSSSEDGSFPQLLHLASLSEILKCICRHFKHCSDSLPILQVPISTLPIGAWVSKLGQSNKQQLAMLWPHASLGEALSLLIQAGISSIPIVDINYSLQDMYSRRDIIALVRDKMYARIDLDGFSIHQALLLGRDAGFPCGLRNGPRCHMCLRSDSLHKVMERLTNPGVRRLVVVEAGTRRVEGIISISDIFRLLLCC
ncbi:sucrose nonfermenting 4-like protein isoform X1 [Vigna radiata var. radiata]|uniref:Sucrose nonfermenting 4-like protein isoform X1 n=1 Tax=Vigna radiata var. radiata TaxID=3916 RepID=A0A1S3V1Y9_VIGRR|nr:sucrose nonfermenting 4-like protein isoform X1 [Vigna radiata var. radiata]XP_014512203.1 sucrose nonfermenting 4-like protein isoform X1 [Vigna radiata var. radiata]XP_022640900.1 sucrose nonfermenting 4-like protein isoform X1 [Vigna radiata var. radiata]XP_022640901.1 sucrose nonfermenting 4-like protein isoform X1 [Vigna radiata var. radiata]